MFFFGIILAFMDKPRFKSVFLSDIHLGTKGCQADILNEFLKNHDFDNLFLVGDIIDGWRMSSKTYWPQEHVNTIRRFLHFAKKGTKIFLISGFIFIVGSALVSLLNCNSACSKWLEYRCASPNV